MRCTAGPRSCSPTRVPPQERGAARSARVQPQVGRRRYRPREQRKVGFQTLAWPWGGEPNGRGDATVLRDQTGWAMAPCDWLEG
eukprot:scaffold1314_cov393-Prasinococcus_capsulatus_cf.AAC.7